MLTKVLAKIFPKADVRCNGCGEPAVIEMHGYATDHASVTVCADCGLQLARKLLEDLCDVLSKGGRHG